MHPDPAFHSDNRDLNEALLYEVGFGTVFVSTDKGPRIAHSPLHSTRDGAVQFFLPNASELVALLNGAEALLLVNGPDAYVSPRWYEDSGHLPTWNYVSLELEGRVRTMAPEGLADLLGAVAKRSESRLGGENPWTPYDMPPDRWQEQFGALTGFEMEVRDWRPTLKLSQDMPDEDRERVADALSEEGAPALAQLMRVLAK